MLQGFQFDKMQAYPTTDASLFSYLAGDRSFIIPNRGNELNVTTSELNITVDTGEALILGRQIKITEPMVLTIGANQSGYLVIEIDLSKANTSTGTPGQPDYEPINNQLSLKFVNNLTQDNINDGGLIYQFNLGTVSSTSNSITFNKASNIMGGVYRKLLFQGAIKTGDITLTDNMYNYRFLYIKVSSGTTGFTYGGGMYTIIDPTLNNSNNKTQAFVGYEVPENDDPNTVITYSGQFVNKNETTLTVFSQIGNVTHKSGSNHTGGTKYYVREIFGIR
ncbi:hypothetical protein [Anaerofustis butyriciformans]|uniref:hypothetical protein n=1 Tax=Anaerofustis butyriciformans TaxID=3108533 RepID=UPI002E322D21|nr:hypothetical protein [Anaerofustis sp. HA2171]